MEQKRGDYFLVDVLRKEDYILDEYDQIIPKQFKRCSVVGCFDYVKKSKVVRIYNRDDKLYIVALCEKHAFTGDQFIVNSNSLMEYKGQILKTIKGF